MAYRLDFEQIEGRNPPAWTVKNNRVVIGALLWHESAQAFLFKAAHIPLSLSDVQQIAAFMRLHDHVASHVDIHPVALAQTIMEVFSCNNSATWPPYESVSESQRCREDWDKLPTTSEHLWNADHHGIPSGPCVKCGEMHEAYNRRLAALFNTDRGKELIANYYADLFGGHQ